MTKDGGKTGGRKKGTPNKSQSDLKVILDAEVDFGVVVSKLFELVEGIEVQEKQGDEMVVYSKPPDAKAADILLAYRFGRPNLSIAQNISFNKPVVLDWSDEPGTDTDKTNTKTKGS